MKKVLLIAGCIAVVFTSYSQQKQPILVTDLLRIKEADNITISPDGKTVVYTVKSIVPDTAKKDDYVYNTRLWQSKLSGGEAKPLTKEGENATQPAFSPDGKTLVYVKNVKGKPQLFIHAFQADSAWQLTSYVYGAGNPQFSPDGKRLLFTASVSLAAYVSDSVLNAGKQLPVWNDEKPGFVHNEDLLVTKAAPDADGDIAAIRSYLLKNEKDKKAKVITRVQFQGESTTSGEVNFSHVFMIEVAKGATPRAITSGYYSFRNARFVNNDLVVLNGKIDDTQHPDNVMEEQIYTVRTNGTGLTKIVSEPGMAFSVQAVSASGKWLAYQRNVPGTVHVPALYLLNLLQPNSKPIAMGVDRSVSAVRFTEDEKQVYFTVQTNGGEVLYTTLLNAIKPVALTPVDKGVTDFDVWGKRLVWAQSGVDNPSEVYVADATAQHAVLLSSLNTGWLANKEISYPTLYTFTNSQGMQVEYWVMKPASFGNNKKYPLLLEMHGGPASMWGPSVASMWHEYQYYCAKGIGVVYSNPRGSSGYGTAFLQANVKDWGEGPASDVLTALDKTVALGWADTSKLLISGGSYAGYLTTWIISHDHRFRAASSQRGVYHFNTFFGEANVWRMVPRYFGNYPWNDSTRAILERQSPLNYATNITTPFLIFHGESDLRTGVTQSEMLYKTLKVLGRPVEYVRHPGANHELVRSGDNRQRIDQMLRTYEFFYRFIQ
ncbi:Dipeptidyl aminopeptidase/acylaminoacyl peptidase [Filimonas lacunae]|uniref:Dipeptidyl aminopeptidase/acylaminoacyl peptidase n=1 Tax=Filimonas lacunae TaxID=477680 RepID=A0A173MK81_9BACT|nr:S9 family peptidase [Filimonas lacunae]BAV07808.1 acylamino-acid-releasing enzyme [Filimonas lacunae]SIT05054.1 Dipeptidyl aminopeptidase/acylaminoacyl peptidase [Filimonas lacunae]